MPEVILIKDFILDGKLLKKGHVLLVDKERERELKVHGVIENDLKIETAKMIITNKETRKKNKRRE